MGRALGRCLKGGETLMLSGDLGAGKTWFSRGLAEGLGITDPVQSPSFTLMSEYLPGSPDKPAFYHFDAYRLTDSMEWYDLGFSEYPGPRGVAAVEWPERVLEAMPEDALLLRIEKTEDDQTRRLTLTIPQGFGKETAEAVLRAWSPWQIAD